MNELFSESRKDLSDYCANEQHMTLLESETFDLWEVATRSCRKEIKRLERLLQYQTNGRALTVDVPSRLIEAPPFEIRNPA